MKAADDTKELVELIKFCDEVKEKEVESLQLEIVAGAKRLDLLLDYASLNEEDLKLNATTFTWPRRVMPILDVGRKRLLQRKEKVQEDVRNKMEATSRELDEIYEQVCKFQDYGVLNEVNEYLKKVFNGRLK